LRLFVVGFRRIDIQTDNYLQTDNYVQTDGRKDRQTDRQHIRTDR
jgi:hypothetical protein